MDKQQLVPAQERGKQLDLSEKRSFPDQEAAERGFNASSERLLLPQGWKELCGKASATFAVIAPDLKEVGRPVNEGDFLRIDVPGPGSDAGEGYDWVRVAMIGSSEKDGERRLGIKLEPVDNPESPDDTTAHFFEAGSSSTLEIILEGKNIEASYHGRNEVINNQTGKLSDDVRNTVVGAGAKAGLSEAQWGALLKGLIA
ncbi:hypothetical protein LZZ85_02930 [Terrimonas sp. NA20]|uniref:Uncharacterized protein n=1 Tax=Terrimonas ginsenosidimutans TaxID=2908004 RepID=A0ABS9KLM4_9BACT|nr:hypothetical protein [Terrimonas ginsenosidimutans]MCG2613211.1 hypothetical protein [Terrimonas ginsenosidimutans]